MKKLKWYVLLIILLCSFLLLWFSGILPKQVAKIVADIHISKFEEDYEFQSIEYSPFHDSYFIAYSLKGDAENELVMDIPYKYFPFTVYEIRNLKNDYIDLATKYKIYNNSCNVLYFTSGTTGEYKAVMLN